MMEAVAEVQINKYPAYKKSGVDWLGDVPVHWEITRLKWIFSEKVKHTDINLPCGSISYGQVVYKDDEKIPESTKKSYQVLEPGEFLINPLNLNYDLISLRIALSSINVVVSTGYLILKNTFEINKSYFKWLLHRFDVAFMKTLGSGVRQTLSFNHISNCELVLPPLPEQTAIASFLDRKCTLIDKAIAIKEKQIALLKERRQILIQNAVTRGLNPNVKMKDSGVDWIGEIPEHWEVKKVKQIGKIVNGATPSSSVPKFWDGEVVWLTPSDINDVKRIDDSERRLTRIGLNNCGASIVPAGSIILTTRAPIGKVCIAAREMCTNQGCKSIVLEKRIFSDYIFYIFSVCSNVLNSLGTGTTFMELSNKALKDFEIPITANEVEQSDIVDYINKETQLIDKLLFNSNVRIEKLKEYKTCLINEAVTGKIKVC
jgi:type I restriction enzyme S subunit